MNNDQRSLSQNKRMHAMLSDIARQTKWAGEWMDMEDWKRLFIAHLHGQKVIPGIDGGFVVLNKLSRKMRKAEVCELIDLIQAWGDMHEPSIRWGDPSIASDEYYRQHEEIRP